MVLEQCFEGTDEKDEKNDEKERIKKLFTGRFDILEDRTIVSRVLDRIRCKPRGGVWQYCVHDEHQKIDDFIVPNQWDIVGQIRENDFFIFVPSLYLQATDLRKKPKGLKCGTGALQKHGLVQLFATLRIPMDDADRGEVYSELTPEIEERARQVLEKYGIRRDKQPVDRKKCFEMVHTKYREEDNESKNEWKINEWVRYLYWKKEDKTVMCDKLKEWLYDQNLLFDENGKHMKNL